MRAGRLREQITIQTPPTGVGSKGQKTGEWSDLHENIPASVRELNGKSLELAKQYLATCTHDVMIRWREGVNETCSIVWGERTLGVGHVRDADNKKSWLILVCEEKKQ